VGNGGRLWTEEADGVVADPAGLLTADADEVPGRLVAEDEHRSREGAFAGVGGGERTPYRDVAGRGDDGAGDIGAGDGDAFTAAGAGVGPAATQPQPGRAPRAADVEGGAVVERGLADPGTPPPEQPRQRRHELRLGHGRSVSNGGSDG
jgi:hypothetical protein